MLSLSRNAVVHPLDKEEEGGKDIELSSSDSRHLTLDLFWSGASALLGGVAEWVSCRSPFSYCDRSHGKKAAIGIEQVDLRGRAVAEISTVRRPMFLGGGVCWDVPALTMDPQGASRCVAVSGLNEAPMSGLWRGKFFDGYSWQDAEFTLFFQDLSHYGKRRDAAGSCICGQDVMGSCVYKGARQGVPITGSYNPENGRLVWSQTAPSSKRSGCSESLWEIWAQFYRMPTLDSEMGSVLNRILATWQDGNGKRGNLELLLCEGTDTVPMFVVGDSFWSRNGSEPFVYEEERVKRIGSPRRIGDSQVFKTAHCQEPARLPPVICEYPQVNNIDQFAARAPAQLMKDCVVEDLDHTLI